MVVTFCPHITFCKRACPLAFLSRVGSDPCSAPVKDKYEHQLVEDAKVSLGKAAERSWGVDLVNECAKANKQAPKSQISENGCPHQWILNT